MQITPGDVANLPDRVGRMVFDRTQMKWIRAPDANADGGAGLGAGSNDSQDPFQDIESLHGDDSVKGRAAGESGGFASESESEQMHDHEGVVSMELDQSPLEESEEDEEEVELNSFSCDRAVPVPVPASEDEEPTGSTGQYTLGSRGAFHDDTAAQRLGPALQDTPPHLLAPPAGTPAAHSSRHASHAHAHAHSPAMRPATKQPAATPTSALKDPSRSGQHTPAHQVGHRRSVSFSDGKRDGPIAGIGRNVPTPTPDSTLESLSADEFSEITGEGPSGAGAGAGVSSARTKRIADMLEDLEDVCECPSDYLCGRVWVSVLLIARACLAAYDDTPSKASTVRPPTDASLLSGAKRAGRSPVKQGTPRREAGRRSSSLSARSSRSLGRNANNTFLTECSFGVAHDKLAQVLTDVQPYEPFWEELTMVDLSHKNLDSAARLKEFTPRLDSLLLCVGGRAPRAITA